MQRSRQGPIDSSGYSLVNICDDSSPIDIQGPDGNGPTGRNEAKLQKKEGKRVMSLCTKCFT